MILGLGLILAGGLLNIWGAWSFHQDYGGSLLLIGLVLSTLGGGVVGNALNSRPSMSDGD